MSGWDVIVVGGGQTPGETIGNGRATALQFAREGASVAVADLDLESAWDTVSLIEADGGSAFAWMVDVRDESTDDALTISSMFDVIHRWRRTLATFVVVVCVLTAAALILTPNTYTSRANLRPESGQEVLGLKTIQIPHLEGMYQGLLPSVRMGDMIDQLDIVDLVDKIPGHDFLSTENPPAIGGGKSRFIPKFFTKVILSQCFQRRVEDIQDQSTTRRQMPMNRF